MGPAMASRMNPPTAKPAPERAPSTGADGALTLATQLEGQIRSNIINGQFEPGERLRLSKLTDRYQAGPIPLREALSRLLASGLVIAEDQRGFRVADISASDYADLSNVRSRFETVALRESIESGDLDWEVRVITARHRLFQIKRDGVDVVAAGFDEEWEARHRAFHLALVSGCNSPILLDFIKSLLERATRYSRVAGLAPKSRTRKVGDEHAKLAEATLNRDADQACKLLEEHFSRTRELIRSVLDSR